MKELAAVSKQSNTYIDRILKILFLLVPYIKVERKQTGVKILRNAEAVTACRNWSFASNGCNDLLTFVYQFQSNLLP
jgi:hypothetical protein